MATFRKSGARKPIATGKVTHSYGMRSGVNDGARGATISMFGDADDRTYSLHLTDDELDRIVAFRNMSKPEFDAQDARNGVPAHIG